MSSALVLALLLTPHADAVDFLEAVPELTFLDELEGPELLAQKEALKPDRLYALNVPLHRELLLRAKKEGLPIRSTQLDPSSAKIMQTLAFHLRKLGFSSLPSNPRVRPLDGLTSEEKAKDLRRRCNDVRVELYPGALQTLNQILQIESVPLRLVLVEQLAKSKSPQATKMLTQRVLFDLDEDVRRAAREALEKRPTSSYATLLVDHLDYPWPAAQEHALETLKKLPKKVVQPLLEKKTQRPVVRELVRLNHLRNCLVCHAPCSPDLDGHLPVVRGGIPMPGKTLVSYYGGKLIGQVRADITTLRPDFSVVLTHAGRTGWPAKQRFDFLTRTRPASEQEIQKLPSRTTLLKALEELRERNP